MIILVISTVFPLLPSIIVYFIFSCLLPFLGCAIPVLLGSDFLALQIIVSLHDSHTTLQNRQYKVNQPKHVTSSSLEKTKKTDTGDQFLHSSQYSLTPGKKTHPNETHNWWILKNRYLFHLAKDGNSRWRLFFHCPSVSW